MDQRDLAFHDSFKPRWGPMDSLLCAKDDIKPLSGAEQRWQERFSVFSEGRDVAVMDYKSSSSVSANFFTAHHDPSDSDAVEGDA